MKLARGTMPMGIDVRIATPDDADTIARMVKELTDEIIAGTGEKHFDLDLGDTSDRARKFIEKGYYLVFLACDAIENIGMGFVALCESYSLYAEGAFGIIQELFVAEEYRSRGIGRALLSEAKNYAKEKGWKRLELCTPPLPQFARTLTFYEREGFEVTGGRKMKYISASI